MWKVLLLFKGCKNTPGRSHRGYWSRVLRHLNDFWNVVDLLSYILLIIALSVREANPDPPILTFARNMFALSLLVMYLRILEVFLIHRIMGPTIIMIKEMVLVFVWILTRTEKKKQKIIFPKNIIIYQFLKLKDLLRFLFIAVCGIGSRHLLPCKHMAGSPKHMDRWLEQLENLVYNLLSVLAALRWVESWNSWWWEDLIIYMFRNNSIIEHFTTLTK